MTNQSKKSLSILFLMTAILSTVIGQERNRVITTAVPFLRVNHDGRTGGMGDAGVASSPDVNSYFLNASSLAFIENDFGMSLNFTPWLSGIANDVYLANFTGYYKIKDVQTIAASVKYFSLGNIQFTNSAGDNTGEGNPNEFSLDFAYARKLTDRFSLSTGLRYVYSNLRATQVGGNQIINPGMAIGADLTMMHKNPIQTKNLEKVSVNWGLAISNIGSKMTYSGDATNRDFIPTNLGVGLGGEMDIDEFNAVNLYFDINKLLVPTPPGENASIEEVNAYRSQSPIGGMFSSFGDAPGGFNEEMKEFMLSWGAEYVYNKILAIRAGYFYEAPTKGDRQFLTAGVGLTYSVATINFSYVIPTSNQRQPLDNTMRFSILFNFNKGGKTVTENQNQQEDI